MPYRRREVKTEAKESLRYSRPRWWKVVVLSLLLLYGSGLSLSLLTARVWIYAVLPGTVLLLLTAQCLRFGFQGYCLGTYRSALTGYWNLFSGFRRVGPVCSLAILRGGACLLWSLIPVGLGVAVQVLLLALGARAALEAMTVVVHIRLGVWTLPLWIDPVMDVALLLSAGVGTWKALQYRMAPYLMLDDPLTSVWSAIRKSRAAMRGRCRALFALHLSFLGYPLLAALVLAAGALVCGAAYVAAAGAASLGAVPALLLETFGRAAARLAAGDFGETALLLTAPYAGILAGELRAAFYVLPPFLPPLAVMARAAAYGTCAEAGFYDALSGKRTEKQAAVRQAGPVWAGFD